MKKIYTMVIILSQSLFLFTACEKDSETPNIVLILADDMGYSDIGCYGGVIETPNLDRLAAGGVMFTHFYNSARCNPSRASLLTGLHPHQTGVGSTQGVQLGVPGYMGQINENCVTIGEVLQPAGYSTYAVGKWPLTYSEDGSDISDWPLQRGFDRFFGTIYGAGSYFDPRRLYNGNSISYSSPEGFYYTDAISDTAVAYINDHTGRADNPFFLYVAYTAPHWPMQALPEDIEKYRGRFDSGWDEMTLAKIDRMKSMGLIDPEWEITIDRPGMVSWDDVENREWEIRRMEVYAAMVDCMDRGIGRIIRALEESGEINNTLLFFLSDNGACSEVWDLRNPWAMRFGPVVTRTGDTIDYSNDGSRMPGPPDTYFSYGRGWSQYSNTPFFGHKSSTWEGGISSPFIVHWPDKVSPEGGRRDQVTGIIDIMPTIVSVSGADYPVSRQGNDIIPMQGTDLVPVILENLDPARDYYYVEHIGNNGIISSEGKKAVKIGRREWSLFDLESDRTEYYDLRDSLPEIRDMMVHEWQEWAARSNVLSLDSLAAIRRSLNNER